MNGLPVLMGSEAPKSTFVNKDAGHETTSSSVIGKARNIQHPVGSLLQSPESMLQGGRGKSVRSYEQQKRINAQMNRNLYNGRMQFPPVTLLKANDMISPGADVGHEDLVKGDIVQVPIPASRHKAEAILWFGV